MAETTTIARPYAQAAFELARAENALPAWSEMLNLAAAVAHDPQLAALLGSPRISRRQLADLFQVMRAEAEGVLEASMISAQPVTEAQRTQIIAALKARLNREITLTV